MKMTMEALQRMGVARPTAERIAEAFEGMQEQNRKLAEEKDALEEELEESRKRAAVEKAVLEAGGKNCRAILALIDLSKVTFHEKNGLSGLDLAAVKAEAPYLFYEKEERTKGTGLTRGQKRKENEISEAFKKGLGR